MKLSIVSTLYRSSPYVKKFYDRIVNQANKITDDFEIIFVDDGSPDNSLEIALDLHAMDKRVKVIELSRNFGHHKAIMTGLAHATGDYIFLIDIDLEEDPELLGTFWRKMNKNPDIDVVYGIQQYRKGNLFEQWSGGLFWKLLNFFSEIEIPSNQVTARLMTQRYIQALKHYHEYEVFTGGIMYLCGFHQVPCVITKKAHSKSTYTLRRKLNLLINAVSSLSSKPLIYIFNIGVTITFFSSLYIIKLLIDKVFFGISIDGWASIVISIWFFGGLIILFLGIIGIYLSKIFNETKNRPRTVIRHLYSHSEKEGDENEKNLP